MKKRVLIVFGTRPEAIKMAPVVKAFQKKIHLFETKVCITAQHREMLDQVLNVFEISADYDLDIMQTGQDLYDISARVLLGMKSILLDFKPEVVLVHGDTTTSSFTALACFYQQIEVAHVEAGLRTFDISAPWPEELNRQITGRVASYHFAPTVNAKQNLLKENISEEKITVTGNTVIDALKIAVSKIKHNTFLLESLNKKIKSLGYHNIDSLNQNKSKLILITGHRRENFGEKFIQICEAIKDLALSNPSFDFVYPVHLNPNVQKPVYKILNNIDNVFLIQPLEYLPFIFLMEKSYFVITDSGGIQEEAPGLGKPVLVMRDTTERPEVVDAGSVKLVGTQKKTIVLEANKLIQDKDIYSKMSKAHNPYGNGNAADKIIRVLSEKNIKSSN